MSLNIHTVRCEALFASTVQVSQQPSPQLLQDAIAQTIRRLGSHGCAAHLAQEFCDHPETAAPRMRWAREQVDRLVAASGRCGSSEVEPNQLGLAA
jgi:hypothetical protein